MNNLKKVFYRLKRHLAGPLYKKTQKNTTFHMSSKARKFWIFYRKYLKRPSKFLYGIKAFKRFSKAFQGIFLARKPLTSLL